MEQQCTRGKVPSIFIAIPMEPWYTIPVEKAKQRRQQMKKFSIQRTLFAILLTGVFVTGCSQNTRDTGADAAKQDIVQETESTEMKKVILQESV